MDWREIHILMKIVFRVDANHKVGFGHLKRSLVIAEYLRKRHGCHILFVVGNDSRSEQLIKDEDFEVEQTESGVSREASNQLSKTLERFRADAILIDIKEPVEENYVRTLKESRVRLAVLDNGGEGCQYADMLFYPYAWLPEHINLKDFAGKIYEGIPYVIIGQDFIDVREKGAARNGEREKSVLVSMGGSDSKGLTVKAVSALEGLAEIGIDIIVILGPYFSEHTRLSKMLLNAKGVYRIIENPQNVAEIMARVVVAVVSAGMSVYELAFLGIPAVVISQSREHSAYAELLEGLGLCLSLGYFEDVTEGELKNSVRRVVSDADWRMKLSEKAGHLIDGLGAQRIGDAIVTELRNDKGLKV